jgi:hypothetical protein
VQKNSQQAKEESDDVASDKDGSNESEETNKDVEVKGRKITTPGQGT